MNINTFSRVLFRVGVGVGIYPTLSSGKGYIEPSPAFIPVRLLTNFIHHPPTVLNLTLKAILHGLNFQIFGRIYVSIVGLIDS